MLQRHRTVLCVHHVHLLVVDLRDPAGEVARVGNSGREKHEANGVGQENNRLLPHHAALLVAHVVDLIVDHPRHLTQNITALVQHRTQNLRRHHQNRSVRIDRHVARHQTHVRKLLLQVAVLLVTQSLDGRCVHDALVVAKTHGDGILGDGCLSSRCVRRHQHRFLAFQTID